MWLYMIAAFLMVVGLVGGVLSGGIFLIIFIPLGLIMLAAAAGSAAIGRSAHKSGGAETETRPQPGQPLPHTADGPTGRVPTSPDALTDARRVSQ